MRKRYFFIPLTVVIIITGIWACKYGGIGPAGIDLSVLNKKNNKSEEIRGLADGLLGYNGEITYGTNKRIVPNMDKAIEVFPFENAGAYYRIPALVVTTNGTLLAFADRRYNNRDDLPNRIEVEVTRSTNNGSNWSKRIKITPTSVSKTDGYGDTASVVVRNSNTVIAITASHVGFFHSKPNKPIRIQLFRSSDEGLTWQHEDITSQIYGPQCKDAMRSKWEGAFVSSGNGVQLSTGRILFVLNVFESSSRAFNQIKNYVMYSDDGGYTWNVSKNAPKNAGGGNEAKIVELSDGRLLMSARPIAGNKRMHAYSSDRGETWSDAAQQKDITAAGSNGDMIYYTSVKNGWDTNRIIHFIPTASTTVTGEHQYNGRVGPANPYFYYSYDDGKTFIKGPQVKVGQQSGYSSLAVLHDGSIGVLYEDKSWGGPIKFMRVNFEWLTRGKDKGPKKITTTATTTEDSKDNTKK